MASTRSRLVKSPPTHSGPSRVLSCRTDFVAEETSHTRGTASFLRPRKRPAVRYPATGGVCRAPKLLPALLTLATLALVASCSAPGPETLCRQTMAQLDRCVADYCANAGAGTPTCAPRSLLSRPADRCAALDPAVLGQLEAGSCPAPSQLFEATGKADGTNHGHTNLLAQEAGYTMNVLSQQPGEIQVELLIHDVAYTTEIIGNMAYQRLEVKNAGRVPEVGRPVVPIFNPMLAVPPTTDRAWVKRIDVDPKDRESIVGLTLVPFQEPQLEDDPPTDLDKDDGFYQRDTWYPGQALNEQPLMVGTWRNYRVIRGTMAPIQYNPKLRQLRIIKRFVVTVGYSVDPTLADETAKTGKDTFSSSYDRSIANYHNVADSGEESTTPKTKVRYLAIVADALLPAVQPLIDAKETAGLGTAVVKLSSLLGEDEFVPKPEKVKQTIRDYYDQEQIEYVLLVGDVRDLPMYSWDGKPSDVWYGCLKGDDPLPEVFVGRLSGKTPAEISAQVTKIASHEALLGDNLADEAQPWQKRILLVNHREEAPGKYTANSEAVRKRRYRASAVEFVTAYGADGATNEEVKAQINTGVGVLAYRGHGSKDTWASWNGEDFGVSQVEELENDGKLPIVLSIACWNLGVQSSRKTLGEAFVQRDGAGAVAFLGATRPSYTKQNDDFNRYLFTGLLDSRVSEIGQLLVQASAKLYAQYGDDRAALANLRMYAWLGDPALRIPQGFYQQPKLKPNGVIINEVLADPASGAAGDANGDGERDFAADEFIELYNSNDKPVDISGWTISDRVGVRYEFPAGTVLGAGQALVLFGGGDVNSFAISQMGGALVFAAERAIQLNNDGDAVVLASATGNLIDRMEYTKTLGGKNVSMVRAVEGDPTSAFIKHPGRAFSPGTRVDGSAF